MRGVYAIALILSFTGLMLIDKSYKLAFFNKPKQTLKILLITLVMFIVWDVAGILSNVFFIGSNTVLLGIRVGQFPVEEIFFLMLLNYTSLTGYLLIKRKVQR